MIEYGKEVKTAQFEEISQNKGELEHTKTEFIKLAKKGDIDLSKYSKEDIDKSKGLVSKINDTDPNAIMNFGLDLQSSLSSYSTEILNNIRSYDAGEIGTIVNDLLSDIDYIDVDPSSQNMFMRVLGEIPIVKGLVRNVKKMKSRYDKVSKNVDDVVLKLDKSRLTLFNDNNALQSTSIKNREYIKNLHHHIIAAEMKYKEVEEEMKDYIPKDEMDYTLSDKQNFLNRLDKKIMDMKLTKTIAIQTLPQISIIQDGNSVLIEKIQSSIANTIPLWKNQMIIALSLDKQRKTLEIQKKITETTNKILIKNSEILKTNSIETARQNEESIVDVENIKKVNQDLIETLNSIMKAKEEGSAKRKQATVELEKAEIELREKILDTKNQLISSNHNKQLGK